MIVLFVRRSDGTQSDGSRRIACARHITPGARHSSDAISKTLDNRLSYDRLVDEKWRRLAEAVARELFGDTSPAVYIPSDESHTFELPLAGRAPRIVKFDAGEGFVAREQEALPALRDRGFVEFPEIEFTQADCQLDDVVFNVMPKTPHVPLHELWHTDPSVARDVVARTGDFLRRLATVPWESCPAAVSPSQRATEFPGWFRRWWEPLRGLDEDVDVVIDAALAMMSAPPAGFGGWAGGAVLSDGTTFTVIDWATIGAFWPLCDLASRMGFEGVSEAASRELERVLVDAYTAGAGLEDREASELSRWLAVWALFHAGAVARTQSDGGRESALLARRLWDAAQPGLPRPRLQLTLGAASVPNDGAAGAGTATECR